MGENNLALLVLKEDLKFANFDENIVSEYEIPFFTGAVGYKKNGGKVPQFFLSDDIGADQISEKYNRYGAFTAVYWAWKNLDASYVGIVMQEKHFALSDEEILQMFYRGTDAILPMQVEAKGGVSTEYSNQYYGYDWQIMMQLLSIAEPEYYETARLLFDYNMVFETAGGIYTWECFDAYCRWLFPLLDQLDKMCSVRVDSLQNKCVEHLGNCLHYLYFMHNHDKLQLCQSPLFDRVQTKKRTSRILSEFDIIQYTKSLFKQNKIEEAADFMDGLEKKHLRYADVRRIKNMLEIYRIQRRKSNFTVIDRIPDVDRLIAHHQNLENYIVNFVDGIGRNKDFIRYIDKNEIGPEEILFILEYFEANSAQIYLKFLTLFEEYNKREFVLPFMEAAVSKRNCVDMVEAKMREVIERFG